MVIRISVGEATSAPLLMRRLARIFDRSSITFANHEVSVESEWESRAVMGVVEVVEAWLDEDGAESATLSVGDRAYTLVTTTPLAASP